MPMDLPRPPYGNRALLSEDGVYRYELTRRWQPGPAATFIMMNPSTADATRDDPTIRRCLGFAKQWRCGALVVVNLFAYRTTEQRELLKTKDPVGPDNDEAIYNAVVAGRVIVAAWGAKGSYRQRDQDFLDILDEAGRGAMCLGFTMSGQPRHPLFVRRAQSLIKFHSLEAE